MKRTFLLYNFLLLFLFQSFAQTKGHHIVIKMEGMCDSVYLLSYYYGKSQYLKDTLTVKNKTLTIKGDTLLQAGMYNLVSRGNKGIANFFVDDNDQNFSITLPLDDPSKEVVVKKSENNAVFFQWIQTVGKNAPVSDSLHKLIVKQKEEGNEKEINNLQEKLDALNAKMEAAKTQIFGKNPQLLVSRFMKTQEEIEIPETNPDGTEMTNDEKYYYYKNHFFDHLSLTDEKLLYTPIYAKRVEKYFEKMIYPVPDSVIYDAATLIDRAKPNETTYKYMVWHATNFAESSTLMGMDRAFVYFVDHYYAKDTTLTFPDARKRMMKRADELRHSLVGETAPNMMMQDSAFLLRNLSKVDADYVILYFFDPNCGHCKSETDSLLHYYKMYKTELNFEIFAVCSDTSMKAMKNYMNEKKVPWIVVNGPRTATGAYSKSYDVPALPTLYSVDRNRKILSKKLDAKQTIDLIKREITKSKDD